MNPNICNHCGGDLEYKSGHQICSACGAYKPRLLTEEESVLLGEAFQKLRLYEFDEAEKVFEEIVRKYPKNPEGYWGRLLSKYGITYVSDADGKKTPVCNITLDHSIVTEEDFVQAESLADEATASYYRSQANYIDRSYTEKQKEIAVREELPSSQAPITESEEERPENVIETNKNKKNIFLITGIAFGILLVVLFTIFLLTRECKHKEAIGEAVSPTCSLEGKTEWKYCSLCGEILVPAQIIPATGHMPNTSALCTENQHCNVCGEILRTASDHIPGSPASCAEGQKCTVCHAELSPALGHTPGEPAGCTSGQYCLVCNEELSPALHVPGPPATCTENQTCVLCGFILDLGGHKEAPATCTSGGYCTVCNEQISEPLPHVPGPEPTCTQGQVCTVCGTELAPDKGHVPDKEATCTGDSVCLVCNEVLEQAFGHTMSEFKSCTEAQFCILCNTKLTSARAHILGPEATCTEGQSCLICKEELIPALEHSIENWTTDTEPSLGVKGRKSGVCTLCKETVYQDIPALYSDGLEYILNNDGTYSVSGSGTCADVWIVLPSVHNGIPVTSVADNAFYNVLTLEKISIPEGITRIGSHSFYLCRNLKETELPNGLTYIGDSAFSGCVSITSVSVASGILTIGNNAFSGCVNLTEISLPSGLTSIGNSAFANCSSLTEIIIPDGVTSIGTQAFYYCGNLAEIILPDSVTSIGDYAFYFCNSLTKISISANLKNIGAYAFYRCMSLKELLLPEGITSIGSSAFESCRKLKKFSFSGSSEQWKSILFGENWCAEIAAETVNCFDGEVSIR